VRDEEAVVALLRRETFTLFVRCCDKIHQRALCDCA
jgi:phage host-nuclease inhibitor protein Gam